MTITPYSKAKVMKVSSKPNASAQLLSNRKIKVNKELQKKFKQEQLKHSSTLLTIGGTNHFARAFQT